MRIAILQSTVAKLLGSTLLLFLAANGAQSVSAENRLNPEANSRLEKMMIPDSNLNNRGSDSNNMPATKHLDSIVLGAGCFWGAEKRYQAIPGVLNAVSGYAGGSNVKPSYKEITRPENRFNPDNHAEVVKVTYKTAEVSLETILKSYFEGHDPTQLNRQGNDKGTQYRSIIMINSAKQEALAKELMAEYQKLLFAAGYADITTKIEPLKEFFAAEEYHQDYLQKNPYGYCPNHSTGVKFIQTVAENSPAEEKKITNKYLLTGKQILVIESETYCPYCEKFKQNIADAYQGGIPMNFRSAKQLDGLSLKTPTWATPTIVFLEQGEEVFAHQGYLSAEEFYKALGLFKLGNSEAYKVAFGQGTDNRFCKQYEIFKDTPDGYFVDKLSGARLFDTQDRFDSASGWLSFTKAIDDAVIELEDSSFGMKRIEIRSKSSGIHLGHVFPDGPNGLPRYCINATVLEFKPR